MVVSVSASSIASMDSLSSVPTTTVLPPSNSLHRNHQYHWRRRSISTWSRSRNSLFPYLSTAFAAPFSLERYTRMEFRSKSDANDGDAEDEEVERGSGDDEVLERALQLDGSIPGTSNEFVDQVSSRAYDMRRNLQQSFDSSSYDVLDANPWRESSKAVFVLTHKENQLCTMKTRTNRSEVEKELGLLFSKGKKRGSDFGNQANQPRTGTKFQMFVEDVREGILVFEDQNEAVRYCDLLQGGGGQGCEGVAEIEASTVFDLCRKTRALAVLFRRGRTPPQPESLLLNLKARKHSLED